MSASALLSRRALAALPRRLGVARAIACAFGYEVRLAAGDERVDFGIRMGPHPAGRAALAALTDALADAEDPRWQRVGRFAAEWSRAATSLGDGLPHVVLGFDGGAQGGAAEHVPAPELFAALREGERLAPDAPALAFLECMAGAAPPEEQCVQLAACAARLPADARAIQIGVAPARPGAAVRLLIALPRPRAGEYLRAVGYPGSAARVLALHDRLASGCGTLRLELEVGERLGAQLGIELGAHASGSALRHEEWHALVERLVGSGLCDPAKGAALLAWRTRPGPRLRAEISHVKLVFDGERPTLAKACVFEERRPLALGGQHGVDAGREGREPRARLGDALADAAARAER